MRFGIAWIVGIAVFLLIYNIIFLGVTPKVISRKAAKADNEKDRRETIYKASNVANTTANTLSTVLILAFAISGITSGVPSSILTSIIVLLMFMVMLWVSATDSDIRYPKGTYSSDTPDYKSNVLTNSFMLVAFAFVGAMFTMIIPQSFDHMPLSSAVDDNTQAVTYQVDSNYRKLDPGTTTPISNIASTTARNGITTYAWVERDSGGKLVTNTASSVELRRNVPLVDDLPADSKEARIERTVEMRITNEAKDSGAALCVPQGDFMAEKTSTVRRDNHDATITTGTFQTCDNPNAYSVNENITLHIPQGSVSTMVKNSVES